MWNLLNNPQILEEITCWLYPLLYSLLLYSLLYSLLSMEIPELDLKAWRRNSKGRAFTLLSIYGSNTVILKSFGNVAILLDLH